MNDLNKNKLLELLADQSFFELDEKEKAEFDQLKNNASGWEDDFSLDLAAAAVYLSELDQVEEMPVHLRAKILDRSDEFFASAENAGNVVNRSVPAETADDSRTVENTRRIIETDSPRPFWQWLGWAFAAAACIALAVNVWLTRVQPQPEIVQNPPVSQSPTPKLSAEQERAQLLAAATDALKVPLANPKDAKQVLGEMVWSNSLQKGYIRFRSLPPNDVSKETYQLWIVDEGQNPKTPVNGGVFDIAGSGETIVPIDPELKIKKPLVFAVTAEKPGGVVVSAQEKVVAFAKV